MDPGAPACSTSCTMTSIDHQAMQRQIPRYSSKKQRQSTSRLSHMAITAMTPSCCSSRYYHHTYAVWNPRKYGNNKRQSTVHPQNMGTIDRQRQILNFTRGSLLSSALPSFSLCGRFVNSGKSLGGDTPDNTTNTNTLLQLNRPRMRIWNHSRF